MDIVIPSDCGNSPRMAIVSQFSVDWAAGNPDAIEPLLAEDASWNLIGADAHKGARVPSPPGKITAVEVVVAMSHGKVAACEGVLHNGDERISFCHIFRFAGATKTAKITEIRSYLIPTSQSQG